MSNELSFSDKMRRGRGGKDTHTEGEEGDDVKNEVAKGGNGICNCTFHIMCSTLFMHRHVWKWENLFREKSEKVTS